MARSHQAEDLRRCCDALSASNERLKAENARLREALEEAARIADQWTTPEQRKFGAGGPATAIRAALAQGQGERDAA